MFKLICECCGKEFASDYDDEDFCEGCDKLEDAGQLAEMSRDK